LTPSEAIAQARAGRLLPIYLVAGEEQLLRDKVVLELRKAATLGGIAAFNEDKFTAGEADIEAVIAAARTAPMMSARRFVLLRAREDWEGADAGAAFDRLSEYAAAPVDSTCLTIVASKIDARRKLVLTARKEGWLVACDPVEARALPGWITEQFRARGHAIEREVAELLAALTGPELSSVHDAIERLSLYVGEGAVIDESAIGACVARVRTTDTWALVDAVGARDLGRAIRTFSDAYDPRERGLPLLGALAWSVRQLVRYQASLASGTAHDEAARHAGVFQPSRARELAAKARAVQPKELQRWILVLAETDIALKSSRRPADAILEEMLTRLCRAPKARGHERFD
jgi:DNA polymerase-3 subunit delta